MNRTLFIGALLVSTGFPGLGDELRLKNGTVLTGTWLGGESPRSILFETGGRQQRFSVSDIYQVVFSNDAAAPASPAAPADARPPDTPPVTSPAPVPTQPVAVKPAPEKALVAGVANGITYINRGSKSGLYAGEALQIKRPSAGAAPAKLVCTLTLTTVDADSASGTCVGDPPARLDTTDIPVRPQALAAPETGVPPTSSRAEAGVSALPYWSDPLARFETAHNPAKPPALAAPGIGVSPEIFRVGNGVSAPLLNFKTDPSYTEEARADRISGTVLLSLYVGADGLAHDIRIVTGIGHGLDEMAVQAVQSWRWRPAMKDGQPVNVTVTVELNFRLV